MTNEGFQATVLLELGEIKAICARNDQAQIDLEQRVGRLEDDEDTRDHRQWVHSVIVLVLSQLHVVKEWWKS